MYPYNQVNLSLNLVIIVINFVGALNVNLMVI